MVPTHRGAQSRLHLLITSRLAWPCWPDSTPGNKMPARYDVFLSHASTEKPLVEELARRLARENLRPWLDKWNLIPGTLWMSEVEAALDDCASCAVIIG